MATRVTVPGTRWWQAYARRMKRPSRDVAEMIGNAARTPSQFPHVAFRIVNGASEAYVPDTGLAIWEIAWLARSYGGDAEAIARHTNADPDLVRAGLGYAASHSAETDAEISLHTETPLEELLAQFPGMRVINIDLGETEEQTS